MDALKFLDLPSTLARTCNGKSKLYKMIAGGNFPQPVKIGRKTVFVESEVDEWIRARIAERGGATSSASLVTEREVAAVLSVSLSFLQKDRISAKPTIPFVKVGHSVRYNIDAVRAALSKRG